jgi:DNA polymerase-3 subunit beta
LSFSDDGLVVEAGGTEEARASEAMEATFTGEPLTIAFNPQYLLEGLSALGAPTAVLSFIDAFKPAVLSPAGEDGEIVSGYRYLIMPIRVAR